MKLLLDEHLSPRIAAELRRSGLDVQALAERPDLRGRPDRDLVELALAEDRAIVTFDLIDHLVLHREALRLGLRHPGLVVLASGTWRPSEAGIGALVAALARLAVERADAGDLDRQVIWLPGPDR